jgi:hypothetical protein
MLIEKQFGVVITCFGYGLGASAIKNLIIYPESTPRGTLLIAGIVASLGIYLGTSIACTSEGKSKRLLNLLVWLILCLGLVSGMVFAAIRSDGWMRLLYGLVGFIGLVAYGLGIRK